MSCSKRGSKLFSFEDICLRIVYLYDNLAIYGNSRLIRARNVFISGESRKSIIPQGPPSKGSNLDPDLVMTNFTITKPVAVTSIPSLIAQGIVQHVFNGMWVDGFTLTGFGRIHESISPKRKASRLFGNYFARDYWLNKPPLIAHGMSKPIRSSSTTIKMFSTKVRALNVKNSFSVVSSKAVPTAQTIPNANK